MSTEHNVGLTWMSVSVKSVYCNIVKSIHRDNVNNVKMLKSSDIIIKNV